MSKFRASTFGQESGFREHIMKLIYGQTRVRAGCTVAASALN